MLSRRSFLKVGAAAGAGLSLSWFGPTLRMTGRGMAPVVLAQIPGGTLDPAAIPKYTTPLLIPPAMPRAGKIKTKDAKQVDYYEIALRQFQQQILPAGLPATTVWGYGPKGQPTLFHAPSLTIEADQNRAVRIKWVNELMDATGNYLPHLLPVDPTLHWANPPGGVAGRDMRPTFTTTPGRYTGPVPMVSHVHGAVDVGDESDGYAEAWYLPAATNIPSGYARVGTWYDYFKNKAVGNRYLAPGTTAWEAGTAVFQYPNSQRASTVWYHDHTLGMTRLNVYAGPAGFYIIRGGLSDWVLDTRTGKQADLPGPAPALGDKAKVQYYEIPFAIQDRAFNTNGSLFYPDTRAFFDGITGPYIPDSDISPIWNPEFFGNCIMVNGNTWPYLNVEQRRYRFRFLNGCDSRFLILKFDQPGVTFWQIGNEGGFLAAPVQLSSLLLGPAERADVIVDFSNVGVGATVTLLNVGPDAPFRGLPIPPGQQADPATTGQVMQFRVGARMDTDKSTPPQFLKLPPISALAGGTTRSLALLEEMSMVYPDAPAATLLGTFDPTTATATPHMWMDPITENPSPGTVELWEFYNLTADAHPMHVHEVVFQVVERQFLDPATGLPAGTPFVPEPWESGFKDTVIAYPGQVTRIRAQFNTPGQFVWHCHIVEHEDNEMMRPYAIGPQPNPMLIVPATTPEVNEEIFEPESTQTNNVYMPLVTNQ
ncbi:MAG: twin-arginine translocation signal domain-containing protein [Caldilinea sp. CFX5]|nr:twin-arginine translocation signal domain-containing protein [Caldilinea sp. CFX5]